MTTIKYVEISMKSRGWRGRLQRLINLGYTDSITGGKPQQRGIYYSLRIVKRG